MLSAQAIIAKKSRYFFPNALHFYQNPPVFVRGEGQFLYDSTGKRYLDLFAGVTVANCGHSNPAITQRVAQQLQTLQHTSIIYLTEPMVELAERLAEILPGDIQQTFFCNSGTEANEGALLLARMATGRKGFLAFDGGLHGRSALTMSVTGIPMWRIDPFLDPDVHFAAGFGEGQAEASLASVAQILEAHGTDIAACIIEPIQGNGGIVVPPDDFFSRLQALLAAKGVLLIVDEVQTAFARTGHWFAIEHFGVVPDIVTYAKALGNGVPIGAFSARPEVAKAFAKPSASTLGGNPVSMTAGLAVLDFIAEQALNAQSRALGKFLRAGLGQLQQKHPVIRAVRGLGLMVGAELDTAARTDQVLEAMKDRGFLIGKNGLGRNVLAFQPPLVIAQADLAAMLEHLDQVLSI